MILNMPVNNGANNTATSSQGQNEYTNFLKRKYSDHEMEHSIVSSQSTDCENSNANNNNNWKKRHIDSEEEQTTYGDPLTSYSIQASEEYKQHRIHDNQEMTSENFNIIANSSFINDLFIYDANLIVPVSVNSLSDTILTESVTFSTPSSVCANAKADFEDNNGEHWHTSDLLELDHRYNSSLQTEISQLNPTVNLKTVESHSSLQENTTLSPLLHQQQQIETHQFILPQKPVAIKRLNTSSSSTTTSCSSSASSPSTTTFNTNNHEQDCDFEDKNLSWLLNFKFDEFPHLNPDLISLNTSGKSSKAQLNSFNNNTHTNSNSVNFCPATISLSVQNSVSQGKFFLNTAEENIDDTTMAEKSKSPKDPNKTGKKFEELVMEVTSELEGNEMIVAENVVIEETSHRAPKKPPFTYTELIEYALEDKGELTVSGIYQWISDRFPYYKSNDDRWKNSVRHNLSINPHFRKGHKAPQGAGHLWTISSGDSAENVLAWEHKKQRLDLFFKMESINRERLQQHRQKQQQEKLQQNGGKHNQGGCQQDQYAYDEAAAAATAIQQEMLQQNHNNNDASIQDQNPVQTMETSNCHVSHDSMPYNDLLTEEELRKTAGQILNGIHRDVEVQSVNQTIIGTYQDILLDNDYLNPIHKDVVVNESGLHHNSNSITTSHYHSNHPSAGPYYVTEIDPLELGIQMTSHHNHRSHPQHHHHQQSASHITDDSEVALFNDEFNLNYFTYNPAHDIVA